MLFSAILHKWGCFLDKLEYQDHTPHLPLQLSSGQSIYIPRIGSIIIWPPDTLLAGWLDGWDEYDGRRWEDTRRWDRITIYTLPTKKKVINHEMIYTTSLFVSSYQFHFSLSLTILQDSIPFPGHIYSSLTPLHCITYHPICSAVLHRISSAPLS